MSTACASILPGTVAAHQILQSLNGALEVAQLTPPRRQYLAEQTMRTTSSQGIPPAVQSPPSFDPFSWSCPIENIKGFSVRQSHQN
eukprot:5057825-Amphidinium_carterae.1